MKKILLILPFLISSCSIQDESTPIVEVPFDKVIDFQYNEHAYIKFIDANQVNTVHNSNCPKCKEEHIKEIVEVLDSLYYYNPYDF